MKLLCIQLIFYFSGCMLLASAISIPTIRSECAPAPVPVPLFVWASQSSEIQISHTPANQQELQHALQGVISPFGRSLVRGAPEVVVVFVHRLLRTDEVSRFGDAYKTNSGGALRELKSAFTSAHSKIYSTNYLASENGPQLSKFLSSEFVGTAAVTGRTAIVASYDVQSTSVDESGVVRTSLRDVIAEISARGLESNGVTDVVVVLFDSYCGATEAERRELIGQDDALVGRVLSAAGSNAVAVFTADGATPSTTFVSRKSRVLLSTTPTTMAAAGTPNTTVTSPKLMSAPVAAGLLTSALGLGFALLGFICLFKLQTPLRFETPDKSAPLQQPSDD